MKVNTNIHAGQLDPQLVEQLADTLEQYCNPAAKNEVLNLLASSGFVPDQAAAALNNLAQLAPNLAQQLLGAIPQA